MSFIAKRILREMRHQNAIECISTSLRSMSLGATLLHQHRVADKLANIPKRLPIENNNSTVLKKIDEQVAANEQGRLFAVVHLCGKQFKVTTGDIILVEGYWPPTIGDEIRLEKVLLAGARDFTLIGAPFLQPGLVNVQATIIEKTLTHTKTHFRKRRRKQYMRTNFQRSPNTMIRINSIDIEQQVQAFDKDMQKLPNEEKNELETRFF